MLVQLLYVSRAHSGIDARAIDAILAQARQHNPVDGITGVLCHTDQLFLQLLEGGREQVNRLYGRILRDPRHSDVTLLAYAEVRERRYAAWTMGQSNLHKLNPATLLRYSALPTFDPYRLPGASALALIDELMASAAVLGRA
ncbi:hypothetical protein FHW58_004998 [Duganella sp. 1224]|uniref:BLUF domain-containing protein n=1 Tax=Duganella sp. 1224 TaxID=2587052 RepID=UPI0015CA7B88|nr:BLUF domain-containing protein [Duganella sp. 1224]NYE63767.1 hypothetical protein [Duganella sp. 1224]